MTSSGELVRSCGAGSWLFRVALRSQPVDAAASRHPLVDLFLALEPFDVADVDAWAVRLDLPVTFLDSLHFEGDARGFGFDHAVNMRRFGPPDQGRPGPAAIKPTTPGFPLGEDPTSLALSDFPY
jgi:hypothetical protein